MAAASAGEVVRRGGWLGEVGVEAAAQRRRRGENAHGEATAARRRRWRGEETAVRRGRGEEARWRGEDAERRAEAARRRGEPARRRRGEEDEARKKTWQRARLNRWGPNPRSKMNTG